MRNIFDWVDEDEEGIDEIASVRDGWEELDASLDLRKSAGVIWAENRPDSHVDTFS
jgi:hypothetical protein